MPSDDFEKKSHYTYDEMMDRLKESRSGSGIGGPEGPKRRRRSQQADLDQRSKTLRLAIITGIVIILLLAIPVILFMMSRSQYGTDAFRRSVNARVSMMVEKNADFGPFSMQGNSLLSQKLEIIDQSNAGIIQRAMFKGLRGDFSSTIHSGTEWPIRKLVVNSAQIVLGLPSGASPILPAPPATQLTKPIFGLNPEPTAIVVGDFFVRELDVAWGNPSAYDTLRGAKLQAQVVGNSATFQLADGKLRFGELDEMTIGKITGDLSNNKLTLSNGVFGFSRAERGSVTGVIDLSPEGGAQLNVTMVDAALTRWLDLHHRNDDSDDSIGPWAKRFKSGLLSLNAKYLSSFDQEPHPSSLSGTFKVTNLIVRDWHLFYTLGLVFEESQLNNLKFDTITGAFRWVDGKLEITDLNAEHRGLIKLAGAFSIEDTPSDPSAQPAISGKLRIGLPAVYLDNFAGGYPSFFSPPENAFGWMDITLSGPLDEPRHDFIDHLPLEIRNSSKLPSPPWELNN